MMEGISAASPRDALASTRAAERAEVLSWTGMAVVFRWGIVVVLAGSAGPYRWP